MRKLVFAAFVAAIAAPVASAGTIERACIQADRRAASRSLCGCIQDAADLVLSRSDQRVAASFFKEPHKAQEIRQSDNASNEAFWKRYKTFGATAQTFCR